jgi:acid stress-induced BolA-like protein IbaG/YrbA
MNEKVGIIVEEIDKKYSDVKRAQMIKNKMQEDLGDLKWKTLNITENLKRL